jgi:hypothetical protein
MKILLSLIAANIPTALFCIGGIYLITKRHPAPGWVLLIGAMIGARTYETRKEKK